MTFHRAGAAGFTLVEMMIALVLLGLLSAVISTGFFLAIKSWEAVEHHQGVQNELVTVQKALRSTLSNMRAEFIRDIDGVRQIALFGDEQELIFLTPLKQIKRGGDLFWVRLATELNESQDQHQLIASYMPYVPLIDNTPNRKVSLSSGNLDWAELRQQLIDEASRVSIYRGDLTAFRFSYQDTSNKRIPEWESEWLEKENLPTLMRIQFGERSEVWPDLMIRPRVFSYDFTGSR